LNKDGYLSFEEFYEWAKTSINVAEWMDSLLPPKMEKLRQLEKVDDVKELASILVHKIKLDRDSAQYVQVKEDKRTVKYTGSGVDLGASAGDQWRSLHPGATAGVVWEEL